MMKTLFSGGVVALLLLAPLGMSGGLLPVNPIVNGDFELYTSPTTVPGLDAVAGCYGIGHQVQYGSESIPAKILRESGGSPDPDVEGAVALATDPDHLLLYSGANGDSCVWSKEDGYDLVWMPVTGSVGGGMRAWSTEPENSAMESDDYDRDGDREVKIVADTSRKSHNMWQSYASASQGWTMDADAFGFTIENGATPVGTVLFQLSVAPIAEQSTDLPHSMECQLAFSSALIASSTDASGKVAIDPTDGRLTARTAACAPLVAEFNDPAATDDDKRGVLGSLRIVQLSFWNFHRGSEDIIIDDVQLVNPKTVAEAAPDARV